MGKAGQSGALPGGAPGRAGKLAQKGAHPHTFAERIQSVGGGTPPHVFAEQIEQFGLQRPARSGGNTPSALSQNEYGRGDGVASVTSTIKLLCRGLVRHTPLAAIGIRQPPIGRTDTVQVPTAAAGPGAGSRLWKVLPPSLGFFAKQPRGESPAGSIPWLRLDRAVGQPNTVQLPIADCLPRLEQFESEYIG